MPYLATAIRATVIDRQNEVLWGEEGLPQEEAQVLVQPGGKEESTQQAGDPMADMLGGCKLRGYASDGFSCL